jgi:hypothetical protein
MASSAEFFFFSCGSTAQFWALAASMKLSVLFQLLDLGQCVSSLTVKRRNKARHGRSNKLRTNETFSRVCNHITGV